MDKTFDETMAKRGYVNIAMKKTKNSLLG
jgi:hypothetical protein